MVEMRESNGLTSLESKDLKFETWNLGLGICNQNVTIYPVYRIIGCKMLLPDEFVHKEKDAYLYCLDGYGGVDEIIYYSLL